jgi:hypothetical protein
MMKLAVDGSGPENKGGREPARVDADRLGEIGTKVSGTRSESVGDVDTGGITFPTITGTSTIFSSTARAMTA